MSKVVLFSSSVLAAAAMTSPTLAATSASRLFDVPAESASEALPQLARQADLQIMAPAADLAGERTHAVHGRLAPREALQQLLAGTSLRISSETGSVITVRRAAEPKAKLQKISLVEAPQVRPASAVEMVDAPQTSAGGAVASEVVVTGSLVVHNGNQAPTPVTVVDATALQQAAPSNIPDALNQMPQFSGSRSPSESNNTGTAITPSAGNYLNLRNLGIVRSLILLDGQRVPPTSYEGTVDTDIIPQALVQRVDVVTAGASATYGSDALTGVVNFVLDKKFTGLKGSLQAGISGYGDDGSWRGSLAGGAPVLGGRAHLLFSVEHYQSTGIKDRADRPLWHLQPVAFGNGTTIPYDLTYNARVSNSTPGGLILSGPLAFQQFNPDGTIRPFDRGSAQIGGVQIGGDGSVTVLGSLVSALRTDQAFARASYDITDNITAFVEGSWGESRTRYAHVGADSRFGNITIFSGNAFLRPEIQQVLTATNTPSFTFSRHGTENGQKIVDMLSDSTSVFAGLEGRFHQDWNWRLNYSGGVSILRAEHTRNPENTRLVAATDAVRDPATGNIVCRVTLTNPGLYPGCVPIDLFGVGAPSQQALEYVYGQNSQYRVKNTLNDVSFTVSGPVFTLPAGQLSVAVGAEYRTQSLLMTSNADPAVPLVTTGPRGFPSGQGRFGNTNQGSAKGSQDVKEAFGEVEVPLLKDLPFVANLSANGAYRITNYSTSGTVHTWKAGVSYEPVSDLRFRGTISRDIRAPTLNELFAGQQLSASTFQDVHIGQSIVMTTIRSGNPNLVPEVGNTKTFGVVYRPSWAPGLYVSVDYYDIFIRGAITLTSATQQNQDCEDSGGTAPVCALIFRPLPFSDRSAANAVTRIQVVPQNLSQTYTHGLDIEAGYRLPLRELWEDNGGTVDFRVLANYTPDYKTRQTPRSPPQQLAGLGGDQGNSTGNPKWRAVFTATLTEGPVTATLQERYIGSMVRSYVSNIRYVQNRIDPVAYTDLNVTWKFRVDDRDLEAFLNVKNLLDRGPPLVPYTDQPGLRYPTLQGLYDVVGRYFTFGVRFKL
jgi:outer membrane receptor protein involved in Fe transport